ncbi:hypothetical protein N824_25140 [Pedobacter sp. V48]|nr:hypothetical protein N824_25140 [Pedobacter sp. V48]
MFKYLFIIVVVVLGLIYFGNHLDYKKQKISRKEYERRNRLFIALVFIIAGIIFWLRRR